MYATAEITQDTSRETRVPVDIIGDSYTIRGEADPAYILDVARLVDSRMRDIRRNNPSMNKTRVAVLAAINLADELMQERENRSASSGSVQDEEFIRRTRQLITLLDEGLVGDSFHR